MTKTIPYLLAIFLVCPWVSVRAIAQSPLEIMPQGRFVDMYSAKISPILYRQLNESSGDQKIAVEILMAPFDSLENSNLVLHKDKMYRNPGESYHYTVYLLTVDELLSLLARPEIAYAEKVRIPFPELKQEGLDFSLNQVNVVHHLYPDWAGENRTVSIKENGFDRADIDFHNRMLITEYTPEKSQLHATHMASIIGGGGNSDVTAKGVAWKATLTSSGFDVLLPDPDHYFQDYDISVQNHAYGTGIENYYGIEALAYDESCARLPWMVHLFSSGNKGADSSIDGRYAGLDGWANLTGHFKQSKNTITVGGTDSLHAVLDFSSRGPAFDGRIKPEVVAYGHGGTSGAAAIVSGLVLLLQETYSRLNTGVLPPASLIKAVLINTAKDIDKPGPDFLSGYGSICAHHAVASIRNNHYQTGSLSKHEGVNIPLTIPQGTREVRIALAWTDPAGTLVAPKVLVNDLNLRIRDSVTGEIWFPWILNTFPHPDSLHQAAGRGIDTINPVEQVTISFPEPGNYEILVDGNGIQSGEQEYALTWWFDRVNSFEWTYPVPSDFLHPGQLHMLRWKATGEETGTISYKYVDSLTWHEIAGDIHQGDESYTWKVPSTAGFIQFQWADEISLVLSDTILISDHVNPRIGLNCPDSILLFWNTIARADNYIIYRLGEKYMEQVDMVNDTFYITRDLQPAIYHYAVAPVYKGKAGRRSYGLDYTAQGVGCYLGPFYVRYIQDGKAFLEFQMGTLHHVRSVYLEKKSGNDWLLVSDVSPPGDTRLQFTSDVLQQGANYFQITVELENGMRVTGDSLVIYYLDHEGVLIFPNPVPSGGTIRVYSQIQERFELRITDVSGRILSVIIEEDNPVQYPVGNMASGMYFAWLIFENGRKAIAPFIIQ